MGGFLFWILFLLFVVSFMNLSLMMFYFVLFYKIPYIIYLLKDTVLINPSLLFSMVGK